MTKRDDIQRRIVDLKEKARLLKIVHDGGGSFGDIVDGDGNVEIVCKKRHTGVRVSLGIANKIRGVAGAEVPRPKIHVQNLYELTPEILERDFPAVWRYVEEMGCCYLIFNNIAPQDMILNTQRVGYDTLKHWFTKRDAAMAEVGIE